MSLLQRLRQRAQPPRYAPEPLQAVTISPAWRETWAAPGVIRLRAEDLPEPYGPDPYVFGPPGPCEITASD